METLWLVLWWRGCFCLGRTLYRVFLLSLVGHFVCKVGGEKVPVGLGVLLVGSSELNKSSKGLSVVCVEGEDLEPSSAYLGLLWWLSLR